MCVCVCAGVICQERSGRTDLKGVCRWWARCLSFWRTASRWRGGERSVWQLNHRQARGFEPKICAVTCQQLTGQFIFNSVAERVSVYYPIMTQPWRGHCFTWSAVYSTSCQTFHCKDTFKPQILRLGTTRSFLCRFRYIAVYRRPLETERSLIKGFALQDVAVWVRDAISEMCSYL